MPVVVDFYTEGDSWVHRADPRVKLLFVAGWIVLLLVFRNLPLMAAALLVLYLLHRSAGIPAGKLRFVLKALLPVSALMFALRVLFYPAGDPLFQLGPLRFTALAGAEGLVLAVRILALAFAVLAWLYTTESPLLVQGLVRLGLPYAVGLSLGLALRYIPTFQESYTAILQAQQARGLDLRARRGLRRIRALMPVLIAMVVHAFRTGDQLGRALDARAFGARGVRRTYLRRVALRTVDWIYAALILAVTAGLLYLNLRFGFGAHPIRLLL